jgi:hypothetical protein
MSEQALSNPPIIENPQQSAASPDISPLKPRMTYDVNALAWPVALAAATGLITCLGIIRDSGRYKALGLYALSRPSIDQSEILKGAFALLNTISYAFTVFIAFYAIYRLIRWIARHVPAKIHPSRFVKKRSLLWVALASAFIEVRLLENTMMTLSKQANGIILKHASDIGTIWIKVLLEQDGFSVSYYMLIYACGVVYLLVVGWWLRTAFFKRQWSRSLFTLWVLIQVLVLIVEYSSLAGVTDTVDEFPAVAFYNEQALLGPHTVPILLGSDDKQFALLVVYVNAKPEDVQKAIFYVPRSEIKWMAALSLVPLQPLAKYDDLKRLAEKMPKAGP